MTPENPYRPPLAEPADGTTVPLADPSAPRPIAVWIMVLALGVMLAASGSGLMRAVIAVADGRAAGASTAVVALVVARLAAMFGTYLTCAYGLWRRRRWARWLGLFLIGALLAFCLLRQDTSFHADDAERAGALLAQYVLIPAACVWWGWALAFSAKGKRYFGVR